MSSYHPSDLGIEADDIATIDDNVLTAEDIGADRIHDLFQQVFFSSNQQTNEDDADNADPRDIDSQGNSKSPERPAMTTTTADEDELTALLGEDDDGSSKQEQQQLDQQQQQNQHQQQLLGQDDATNKDVEDAVNDVLREEGLDNDDGAEEENNGDVFDWDKISENEEKDRQYEDFDDEDDDFKNWIRDDIAEPQQQDDEDDDGQEDEDGRLGRIPQALAAARAALVQDSMSKMAATADDAKIARSSWPERLKEMEILENRPGLRGSVLPDGSTVELSKEAEAIWILKMLVQPGYPFERRAHIIQEIMRDHSSYRPHPLVKAVEYALECFVEEKLEPAYLMLYRSSQFKPLITELMRCDAAVREAPEAWFGYCANTGRRQLIGSDSRTNIVTGRGSSVGTGYDGFRDFDRAPNPVIRRPAFIPLGRLLTDILFLDGLCNRLERHRHITLDVMTLMNNQSYNNIVNYQNNSSQQSNNSTNSNNNNNSLQPLRWFAPTKHDVEHLSQIVFDSPHSSDVWSEYAEFFSKMQLAYSHLQSAAANNEDVDISGGMTSWARSPSCRLILLGVAQMFEEYAIPGPYLHENVVNGSIIHITSNRLRTTRNPLVWAEDVVSTLDPHVRPAPESLLRLFNDALVEQLTSLPFVREAAMSVFISDGRCEIAPSARSADQQLRVTTVQSLLHRDPALFLELLEEEAGGSCLINFTVDLPAIERIIPIVELLQGCGISVANCSSDAEEAWQRQLLRCREPAARRLQSTLRSHVRVLLHESATRAVSKRCASTLGHLLAEGPYEPCTVRLNKEPRPDIQDVPSNNTEPQPYNTSFSRDMDPASAPLWPTAYEIVESLPLKGVSTSRVDQSQRHRICGCVRGAGGVTVFAFIDSYGLLKHVVRWVDTVNTNESGREIQQAQFEQLRRACRQYEPEVVSLAPTGDMKQSWRLFKEISQCLSRDHEFENQTSGASVLEANIPVVFSSPIVAKLIASSSAITEEFPNTDQALRVTLALARHTQDPLRAICSLFDNSENGGFVGRLPIGCEMFREGVLPRGVLYKKLEWEMVLWVAACGVDATALLGVPSLFAERQLQFIPGLGRRKAARLMKALRQTKHRVLSRKELSIILMKEFGHDSANIDNQTCLPPRDIQNQTAEEKQRRTQINETVVNASPCLRIRPNESSDSYSSKREKISENLKSLYPELEAEETSKRQDEALFEPTPADGQPARASLFDNLAHHLLDETLIPYEWYNVAAQICQTVSQAPNGDMALGMCKLAALRKRHREFSQASFNLNRFQALASSVSGGAAALSANERNRNFFGLAEIDFIIDELISFGAVRARRNYRKMTDSRFFALVTGHTFVESRKKVSHDRKHQNAVLCLGDVIEGVPQNVGISSRDDQLTLRLQGSKGLALAMPVEQLPSELSGPVRDAVKEAQRIAVMNGRDRPPRFCPLPFAFKQMTIYGRLTQVDLATGDARVSYEANPASSVVSALALSSMNERAAANKLIGLDSSRSRESGELQSIKSVQLTVPSRGNALRASSHILYRNISNESAKNILDNSDIGECIIRPCSQPKYGDLVVVVKVGIERESVMNIPVFEDRRSNGLTFYRFVDILSNTSSINKSLEFESIDHLVQNYVRPMCRRYKELADHRHYYPSKEQMSEDFNSRLQDQPNSFVYGIIESPDHARCKFSLIYRGGKNAREHELRLCASGSQILMQHPKNLEQWTRSLDVEMMLATLKKIVCGK